MQSDRPEVTEESVVKGRLFLSAGFLILSAAWLIRGDLVGVAFGAIGLAWAWESYRWSKKKVE